MKYLNKYTCVEIMLVSNSSHGFKLKNENLGDMFFKNIIENMYLLNHFYDWDWKWALSEAISKFCCKCCKTSV